LKILIIKLSALGDVILATPFIQSIQRQHPGAEVHLLTTPPFAPLFKDWPGLKVAAFPRHGLINFLKAVRWLPQEQFDVCYELQANRRTGFLLSLSGIPCIVSNRTGFPATHSPKPPSGVDAYIFDRLNEVMVAGGLAPALPQPWLPIGEAGQAKVRTWLAQHGLQDRQFVVMHAFASARWQSKCWPYFGDLAQMLEAQGCRVVWIGAGTDAEGNRRLAQRAGIDATHQFSINELVELGRHSRFAVTNDSGPMHVLSCSGIPVYAFFGPTAWKQSHALGQEMHVLSHPVPCSPCFLPQCPADKGHACLANLSPQQVLDRLQADGVL
jgi:ADP-heptose:LPS heptosyltransferase